MKQGYKQTEIGVIPEDWEVSTLCQEYNLSAGGDLDLCDFSPNRTIKFKYYIYSNALANEGIYGFCSCPQFCGNAITITGRGDIGHSKYRAEPFSAIVRLLVCQPQKSIISKFIAEYLEFKSPFVFESTGVPQLTVPQIKDTKIPIPPLPEQRRIAEALSNVDELIASLEKLIEKKKALKQGVMQELLTGKRRLPGFTGEWITSNQLFEVVKGEQINGSELQEDLPYPLYNGGVSASGYTSDYNYENRVIISEGGNSCGYINYIKTKFWAGGHCYVVVNAKVLNDYLYQLLKLHETNIMALRVGSGLPNIQKEELKKLRFSYPKETEEQQAIVKVLYDIDLGIRQLTDKLDKVRQIKSGMMSELLTGRIRLM